MPSLPFFTADVFTQTRFGGNPLAVVIADEALDGVTMQAIAAEFNLSETTFVLPPSDPAHTAQVRIFNRTAEMDFAGHPMVGTAFVLASQQPELATASFEIRAGIVDVKIEHGPDGEPVAAQIAAPQPLTVGETVDPTFIAKALNLEPDDVITTNHLPTHCSNGNPYIVAELTGNALSRCDPDMAAFRQALAAHPQFGHRFSIHVYHRDGQTLYTRMFAPLSGTWEDPATGSANAPLACLLLSLEADAEEASFTIHQGMEMGRPSLLNVNARRTSDGITASLRGSCVPVMQGHITV